MEMLTVRKFPSGGMISINFCCHLLGSILLCLSFNLLSTEYLQGMLAAFDMDVHNYPYSVQYG